MICTFIRENLMLLTTAKPHSIEFFFIESRKRKLNSSKCRCILPTYQVIRSTSKPSILFSFGNTLYDIIFV